MLDHHTLLRGNDDNKPLLRTKKEPEIFRAHRLITREIMRSKDAQCNTGK